VKHFARPNCQVAGHRSGRDTDLTPAEIGVPASCILFFPVLSFAASSRGNRSNRLTDSQEAMLVITRKIGESLIIDGDITVTVVKVSGGGVRLGIRAPAGYVIVRNELRDSVNDESQTSPERSKKS